MQYTRNKEELSVVTLDSHTLAVKEIGSVHLVPSIDSTFGIYVSLARGDAQMRLLKYSDYQAAYAEALDLAMLAEKESGRHTPLYGEAVQTKW